MLKEERLDIILQELGKKNRVTYEAFASLLSVSEDTVRRDIDYLYRNGLLTKVRSGAILRSKDPLSFQERTSFATEEKNVIGLKAQQFIRSGMTLFMDGGTTVCAVANHFPINISLRVITNNPALIPVLAKLRNVELIVLGGTYHQDTATTTGADTCIEVSKYIADVYFMGNCAVDFEMGTSASFKTEAEAKRAMIRSAKKVIALAGQNKLRRTEPFKVADMDAVDVLITDLASNDSELEDFRNLGVQLV